MIYAKLCINLYYSPFCDVTLSTALCRTRVFPAVQQEHEQLNLKPNIHNMTAELLLHILATVCFRPCLTSDCRFDFNPNRMGASTSSSAASVQAEGIIAAPPQGCPMHQEAQPPVKGNTAASWSTGWFSSKKTLCPVVSTQSGCPMHQSKSAQGKTFLLSTTFDNHKTLGKLTHQLFSAASPPPGCPMHQSKPAQGKASPPRAALALCHRSVATIPQSLMDAFCSVAATRTPHAPGRGGSRPPGPGLRVCWMSNESCSWQLWHWSS